MSDEMENKTLENEYPEETKDVAEANNASSAADDTAGGFRHFIG